MDKRYQVFISSTFQDLAGARQEVSEALLRAECFPAGMELFPAADEEQFEFIKQVIDQSDYYIVISAGRYGSIHPEKGLSYTELEYDYAVETGKPVIRLLHKNPFNKLQGEFIERTDEGREKLEAFRAKLGKASMVRFWDDPKELGAEVVYGIMDARKRRPAIGWVRADGRATPDVEREVAELKQIIAELELQIEREKVSIIDYNLLIEEISEEISFITILRDKIDEYGSPSETDRRDFSCSAAVMCKAICVSCLKETRESGIRDTSCRWLLKRSGQLDENSYPSFEFGDGEPFRKLLHRLESLGVLRV